MNIVSGPEGLLKTQYDRNSLREMLRFCWRGLLQSYIGGNPTSPVYSSLEGIRETIWQTQISNSGCLIPTRIFHANVTVPTLQTLAHYTVHPMTISMEIMRPWETSPWLLKVLLSIPPIVAHWILKMLYIAQHSQPIVKHLQCNYPPIIHWKKGRKKKYLR
jgi:hypothetical protein